MFKFPAGELHYKIKPDDQAGINNNVHITTDLSNSDEIMMLMLISDHFSRWEKHLNLLYLPYARQDRVTSEIEPFSLKTIARLINSCAFTSVILRDPHSDVTAALIDNVVVLERVEILITMFDSHLPMLLRSKNAVIISPDAGAMKANNKVAKHYEKPHISATKIRDLQMGEITATKVYADPSEIIGKDLIVLDDICDGGRTFIELAKVLRPLNPKSLHLYTTVSTTQAGRDAVSAVYDSVRFNHKLGDNNDN